MIEQSICGGDYKTTILDLGEDTTTIKVSFSFCHHSESG
jgi:hypothetical protein